MSEESREKLARFLRMAKEALGSEPTAAQRGNLRLLHSSSGSLIHRVESLEASEQFKALYEAIEARMGANAYGSHGWKHAVGNWFRRSGLYHSVVAGESIPEAQSLLESLEAELARRESTVTYLALIEYVYFQKRRMDFGRYEIMRFTKDELDALLQTRVRADFYPWATVPTSELARYWWLVIRRKTPTKAIGRRGQIAVSFKDLDIVHRYYTELPLPVELVIQELALFSWRAPWASDNDPRWEPCHIPICLRADDHLTTSPSGPRADTSVLDTEPEIHPDTGEQLGERPAIRFHFSGPDAEAFEKFVRREGTLLHRALAAPWSRPLIEVATRFFAKAFVSDGLEQLLWHMTTIEALVGERGEAVTDRLARRLAAALGAFEEEQNNIKKKFRELYDFRSELVHGRTPARTVFTGHLFEAREFARNLLRWYLRLLEDVQKAADAAGSHSDIPERTQILRLLDLETEGVRKARWLMSALPSTFPRYPDLEES